MPLAVFDAVPTDAEVVRLLVNVELRAAAEPLVSRVVVGEGVPHRTDGHRIATFDDEGRVDFAALDDVAHVVVSLSDWTGEEGAEAVESTLGGKPLTADPLGGGRERLGRQLVGADPADLGRRDDPGGFEHAEVLHDGRERHVERAGELAHRRGTAGQALDHRAPAAVAERVEHPIERHPILRHIPKYRDSASACQGAAVDGGRRASRHGPTSSAG